MSARDWSTVGGVNAGPADPPSGTDAVPDEAKEVATSCSADGLSLALAPTPAPAHPEDQ